MHAGGDAGAEAQGATGGSAGDGGSGAVSGGSGTAGAGAMSGAGGGAGLPGETGGEGGGGVAVAPASISGNWGMFHFEDPVSVAFEQDGERLAGRGCCAGLDDSNLLQCCGPLSGNVAELQASFSFVFDSLGSGRVYGTDVTVSADGQRMGGTFSIDGEGSLKVAWLRFDGARLELAPDPLRETLTPRAGAYELLLSSASVGRFEPLVPLEIRISELGFVASDFGPFYWREMTWNADTEVLTAGPVPETAPDFATQLDLEFVGDTLQTVIARYPGESPYFFDAEPVP